MSVVTERPQLGRNTIFVDDQSAYDTTTEDVLSYPYRQSTGQRTQPGRRTKARVIVTQEGPGEDPAWEKRYWQVSTELLAEAAEWIAYVISLHTPEEYIGQPGDAIASASLWPLLWRNPTVEVNRARGVFEVKFAHRILFTQEVTIQIDRLPRWEPVININRRTVEGEDE